MKPPPTQLERFTLPLSAAGERIATALCDAIKACERIVSVRHELMEMESETNHTEAIMMPKYKPGQDVLVFDPNYESKYRPATVMTEAEWYGKAKCFGYYVRYTTDTKMQSGGIVPSQSGWASEHHLKEMQDNSNSGRLNVPLIIVEAGPRPHEGEIAQRIKNNQANEIKTASHHTEFNLTEREREYIRACEANWLKMSTEVLYTRF